MIKESVTKYKDREKNKMKEIDNGNMWKERKENCHIDNSSGFEVM